MHRMLTGIARFSNIENMRVIPSVTCKMNAAAWHSVASIMNACGRRDHYYETLISLQIHTRIPRYQRKKSFFFFFPFEEVRVLPSKDRSFVWLSTCLWIDCSIQRGSTMRRFVHETIRMRTVSASHWAQIVWLRLERIKSVVGTSQWIGSLQSRLEKEAALVTASDPMRSVYACDQISNW